MQSRNVPTQYVHNMCILRLLSRFLVVVRLYAFLSRVNLIGTFKRFNIESMYINYACFYQMV